VEVAKAEENGLDLWIFILNLFLVEEYKGSLEILFQTLRWLIGKLNGSLQ
jgi:hypothetical protein